MYYETLHLSHNLLLFIKSNYILRTLNPLDMLYSLFLMLSYILMQLPKFKCVIYSSCDFEILCHYMNFTSFLKPGNVKKSVRNYLRVHKFVELFSLFIFIIVSCVFLLFSFIYTKRNFFEHTMLAWKKLYCRKFATKLWKIC